MNKQLLNKAYHAGVREGIERFAHWRDGVQYVGTCGTTLKDAIKRIDAEELRDQQQLEDRRDVVGELGYSRIGLRNV